MDICKYNINRFRGFVPSPPFSFYCSERTNLTVEMTLTGIFRVKRQQCSSGFLSYNYTRLPDFCSFTVALNLSFREEAADAFLSHTKTLLFPCDHLLLTFPSLSLSVEAVSSRLVTAETDQILRDKKSTGQNQYKTFFFS